VRLVGDVGEDPFDVSRGLAQREFEIDAATRPSIEFSLQSTSDQRDVAMHTVHFAPSTDRLYLRTRKHERRDLGEFGAVWPQILDVEASISRDYGGQFC
jgi:hypothetical protein